jgi:hypothetical protein
LSNCYISFNLPARKRLKNLLTDVVRAGDDLLDDINAWQKFLPTLLDYDSDEEEKRWDEESKKKEVRKVIISTYRKLQRARLSEEERDLVSTRAGEVTSLDKDAQLERRDLVCGLSGSEM